MTRFSNEILEHLGIDLPSEVSRRKFLKIFGGGIVVTVSANDLLALQEAPVRRRYGRELPDDFNAFLRIGEDGRVSCFTGKIEMGQGVVTSLAQMLADELEVALDSVDMVMGDTDLCPWDMGTFGSMSVRFFGPALRQLTQTLIEGTALVGVRGDDDIAALGIDQGIAPSSPMTPFRAAATAEVHPASPPPTTTTSHGRMDLTSRLTPP